VKKMLIAGLLAVATMAPTAAKAAQGQHAPHVSVVYGGLIPCAAATSLTQWADWAPWVLGYWSGVTAAGPEAFGSVGSNLSRDDVVGKVFFQCQDNPRERLVDAVEDVFLRTMKDSANK
jgi:hypothetical protein